MKILYATDIDRTLIFSHRFMKEYKPKDEYILVEEKDGKEISYMSKKAYNKLQEIYNNPDIIFVPVTTRGIDEYNRINLGIKPKIAVVASGGIILENEKIIEEYDNIIKKDIDNIDLMQANFDISEMESVGREGKFIENKYVFNKTKNIKLFDVEISPIMQAHTSLNIIRQRNKVYAIPKSFTKGTAVRWLQHYTKADKLVVSGDSELDLTMLAIADYAVVPKHGDLFKCGYVTDGRLIDAGIESPLYTFNLIEQILKGEV